MSRIQGDLEFSKNWESDEDFPTREYNETTVRENIQLLFDETKDYINDIVTPAVNDNMERIENMGGGGSVSHNQIGDNAVWSNNIKNQSITEYKYGNESIPNTAFKDGELRAEKFNSASVNEYVEGRITAYGTATRSKNGLMSANDKKMVDGVRSFNSGTGTWGAGGLQYLCVARIALTGYYANGPIFFDITGRYDTEPTHLCLRFSNAASVDTEEVYQFVYTGSYNECALEPVSTTVWDLYVKKYDNYDQIDVIEFHLSSYMNDRCSITWPEVTMKESLSANAVVATSAYAASKAVITNSNGRLATSATTATEIGYLSGVTSNVQTQLDAKRATSSVVDIAHGGTGQTGAASGANALLIGLPEWTQNPTDSTYFVRQDTGGASSFGRVPFSTVYNYIKSKLTKSDITTALGYTPPTSDTNTWRGIQNNLTSDSTSDSLSAAQGKALKGLVDAKASLVSPVFVGYPTAPTPADGTNNTRIATTAFVQNALSSYSLGSGSDRRMKQDINYDMSKYLDVFDSLKPCEFRYKDLPNEVHTGIIAQDVLDTMNKAGIEKSAVIETENDAGLLYARYNEFIGILIAKVQDLQRQVDELKAGDK